ncbi:MAG: transposase [Chitinophagales bacterium]
MNSLIIGIDVSNKTLDIAYQEDNHWVDYQIENTMKSIEVFLQGFDEQHITFVLEPTGTYSDKLLHSLDKSNCSIKLINPQKSSAFMKVLGITAKDDKQAARALAIAGKTLDLPDFQMPNEDIQKRKKMQMALNAFEKQERQTKNQIHSLMQCLYTPDVVLEAFQDVLNTIQDNIRKIKQELDALTDIGFDKFKELACSVKGIGEKSAQLLYTYTNGFELFTNSKQLVKFVGLSAFDSSIGFFCVSKRTHFKSWSSSN